MYEQPYQQQQAYGQYAPGPYTQQPKRSGIPKVMGILMIIFGSIGLLGSLYAIAVTGTSLTAEEERMFRGATEAMKAAKQWDMIFAVIGLPISLLHLLAGIWCVKYKRSAPMMAVSYAVLTMIRAIAQAVISYLVVKPAMAAIAGGNNAIAETASTVMGAFLVIITVCFIAYSLVVLLLMTRPAAKAACVN